MGKAFLRYYHLYMHYELMYVSKLSFSSNATQVVVTIQMSALQTNNTVTLQYSNASALTLRECGGCWRRTADTDSLDHNTCILLSHDPRLCSSLHLIIIHQTHLFYQLAFNLYLNIKFTKFSTTTKAT